jgi:V8-like Glu-specific endopeptidase
LLRLQAAAAAAASSELGKSYRRLALSSSGASRRSLRALFPEDNRLEVTGTPAYPYSAVVRHSG